MQPLFVIKESSFMKPLCQSKHAAVLKAESELWLKLAEKRQKSGGRRL